MEISMPQISTKATVTVETEHKNKYLYDRRLKKTVLCHPILYFLAQMKTRGEDIQLWYKSLSGNTIEIPGVGAYPIAEITYYCRKLKFLEDSGYFSEIKQEKILTKEITPDLIRSTLANLVQVTFELTDACPMQCYYCGYGKFYGDYDKRGNNHMDFSMIKPTLDYLNELINSPLNISHNRSIFIGFYGGEPLLDFPLIKETVNYANQLNWEHNIIRFTITTNGLFLDKTMDFLVEHDFNIFISLDGDEKNNEYRVLKNGKPTYTEVLTTVKRLQMKYPIFFKRRVFFNAVLHNKNSIEEIFTYFNNQFDKKPSILSLNTRGIQQDQADEFWKTYVNATESLYNSEDYSRLEREMFIQLPTIQDIASFMFNSGDFYYNSYNSFFSSEEIQERYPTSTCTPFAKKLFLTVNGKILACERIGQQFELGKLTQKGIELDFQKIADKYNSWYSHLRKQCKSCYIFDRCYRCIFNLNFKEGKPICENSQSFKDFSRIVSNFLNNLEKKPWLFERIFKEVMIE